MKNLTIFMLVSIVLLSTDLLAESIGFDITSKMKFSENLSRYEWIISNDKLKSIQSKQKIRVEDLILNFSGERGSGGGGDIAICREENNEKFYSLDYLLRDKTIKVAINLKHQTTCENNLLNILDKLKINNPLLATGLDSFLSDFQKSLHGKIETTKRVFHFSSRPLLLVDDEMFNQERLKECTIKQAAVRLPLPGVIHYSVSIDALKLLSNNPLQCSYFLIHEWARDFFQDASVIRKFVNELHSESFFNNPESLLKKYKIQSKINKDKQINESNYYEIIRPLGGLAYDKTNLSKKLKLFVGEYIPVNKEDCNKTLRSKGNKIYISKIYSCSNEKEIEFTCTGLKCFSEIENPNCKSFRINIDLNGFYSNFTISASCNGVKNNLTHIYYKEEYSEEFEELLRTMSVK